MKRSSAFTRKHATVFVVDDEADVRDSVSLLMRSAGLAVETFATAHEFLQAGVWQRPGCLVLDVRMPGLSGLAAQQQLLERGIALPVIFISGHGDIAMAVRAVRAGALDFLEKPFSDQALLDCVHKALELDASNREHIAAAARLERNLNLLTPREWEVMAQLVEGKVNKIIARELRVSTRTVEIHRARVLHKMGVSNVSQLVRVVLSSERYRKRFMSG